MSAYWQTSAGRGEPPGAFDTSGRLPRPRPGARRRRWFDSYVDTVLQREVRDLANVTGLTELPRLLGLLAARATGLLNFAGVSRDLGIPQTTLKRYMAAAVIEPRGGPLCAVEVKAAASIGSRDSRGLRSLVESLGEEFGAGVLLHTGTETVRLAPKVWAMPVAALWADVYGVGEHTATLSSQS